MWGKKYRCDIAKQYDRVEQGTSISAIARGIIIIIDNRNQNECLAHKVDASARMPSSNGITRRHVLNGNSGKVRCLGRIANYWSWAYQNECTKTLSNPHSARRIIRQFYEGPDPLYIYPAARPLR